MEGVIRILIFNHDQENLEILALNQVRTLDEEAIRVIKIANAAYLPKTDEKFMTEFFMEFDLPPFRNRGNKLDTLSIRSQLLRY